MSCRCTDKECHSVTEAVDLIERHEALLGESSDRLFKAHGRWKSENAKDGYFCEN
jgi:hypothetical protein